MTPNPVAGTPATAERHQRASRPHAAVARRVRPIAPCGHHAARGRHARSTAPESSSDRYAADHRPSASAPPRQQRAQRLGQPVPALLLVREQRTPQRPGVRADGNAGRHPGGGGTGRVGNGVSASSAATHSPQVPNRSGTRSAPQPAHEPAASDRPAHRPARASRTACRAAQRRKNGAVGTAPRGRSRRGGQISGRDLGRRSTERVVRQPARHVGHRVGVLPAVHRVGRVRRR